MNLDEVHCFRLKCRFRSDSQHLRRSPDEVSVAVGDGSGDEQQSLAFERQR